MLAHVVETIQRYRMLERARRVGVAVSGGADSVCLLHLLNQLKTELGISLHVAHLDHGLRGPESTGDAAFVRDLARKLELPITLKIENVLTYQIQHRLTLEEAAREVR